MNAHMQSQEGQISIAEVDRILGKEEILDIREPYECALGMLEGAENIPMNQLLMAPEDYLERGKTYYLVCHSGSRSGSACRMLRAAGYDVVNIAGGMARYPGSRYKQGW